MTKPSWKIFATALQILNPDDWGEPDGIEFKEYAHSDTCLKLHRHEKAFAYLKKNLSPEEWREFETSHSNI